MPSWQTWLSWESLATMATDCVTRSANDSRLEKLQDEKVSLRFIVLAPIVKFGLSTATLSTYPY